MTKDRIAAVLDEVRRWPIEDQEELAEVAREIEAKRHGVYRVNDEERRAIEDARAGAVASDEAVRAFWQRHGVE